MSQSFHRSMRCFAAKNGFLYPIVNAQPLSKLTLTRARGGKKIKKPQKGSTQDCILISVSTSNSRKRQKQKELNRERVRQYRARQAELEKAKKTTSATKTSDGSKKE